VRDIIAVGNLFCFPLSRSDRKMTGIVKEVHPFISSVTFRVENSQNTYQVMFDEVIFIPITAERLDKMGFVDGCKNGLYVRDGIATIGDKSKEVRYIHELQILYREETGGELYEF
jgi:hypothetical protein